MSYVLGLTGPTGAGKGVFSKCAGEFGFNVIDCDAVARRAVRPGMPALARLTGVFGEEILLENGELDRGKLAEIAFSSREKTELLNETVLPYVKELVIKDIKGDLVLLDAPTLFESGIDKLCDSTVAVTAAKEVRLSRIIARDGISTAAAKRRISAGKPDEFYKENANTVLENNESIENFTKKVKIYLESVIGGIHNERL